MLPDRVSNLGPLTYESGALPIALRDRFKAKTIVLNLEKNIVYILEGLIVVSVFMKLCQNVCLCFFF